MASPALEAPAQRSALSRLKQARIARFPSREAATGSSRGRKPTVSEPESFASPEGGGTNPRYVGVLMSPLRGWEAHRGSDPVGLRLRLHDAAAARLISLIGARRSDQPA